MHIPTLFIVNVTLSLVVSLTLALTTHRRYSELYLWAFALALIGLGYGMFSLRGQIGDIWSIVGGNTIFSISAALLAEGVYRFQRRQPNRLLLWAPVPVTLVAFSLYMDNMAVRLLLSSGLISLQLVFVLVPLLQRRRTTPGRGQYATIIGAFFALACVVVRFIDVARGRIPESLFDNNPLYSLIFYGNLLGLMLITFGMVLMVQERTLKELLDSENQYKKLIDSAQEGVCVLGADRCIFANPRIAELLGVPAEQLANRPFMDYVHPDDKTKARTNHMVRLTGHADNKAYDIRLLTLNDGPRWFRVSGLRIQWHGEPATLVFLSDIHERKLQEEHTHQLAYHDELTHLPNRRFLADRLDHLIRHEQTDNRHVALMFIDLDNFKTLNDTQGHQAGDLLLAEVARRLERHTRETDTVARLGGDEFVVLLPALHRDFAEARKQVLQVAEKILASLKQPYHLTLATGGTVLAATGSGTPDTHSITLQITHHGSASIGVHLFSQTAASPNALLDLADAAMYQAKQAGRGMIRFLDAAPG